MPILPDWVVQVLQVVTTLVLNETGRIPIGSHGGTLEFGQIEEGRVVLAIDRFLYQPLTNLALAVSARVRRRQSGRLSIYLLYMMIALILALALIPVLR